jgi:hypothetical protein
MKTASPNPFSGLKAMLARILSGGWMGLVLHFLVRRRINEALTALEELFAQWKAGTLAPLAVALPVPAAAPAGAVGPRVAAPPQARRRAPRGVPAAQRPAPPLRHLPGALAAAPRVRVAAFQAADVPLSSAPALSPLRRRARCRRILTARRAAAHPNYYDIVIKNRPKE